MTYYKYIMKIIDFNTKNEKQKVAPIDFSDLKDVRIDSDISKIVENLSVYRQDTLVRAV